MTTEPIEETEEINVKDVEAYIEDLEAQVDELTDQNIQQAIAIHSFVQLIGFISENFGETADYPVRIDSDFYQEHFLELLKDASDACSNALGERL